MCTSRQRIRFENRSLIWFCGILFGTWLSCKVLCFIFTYLNPSLLPSFTGIYSSYKNSEELLRSLKAEVAVSNAYDIDYGFVKNAEDLKVRNEGYAKYGFNVLASRNIGDFRSIPDTRHKMCQNITYQMDMPKASIVICFYNEHLQTLIRTLVTIVRRTPTHLLEQIVLINDFSDIENLHTDVQNYLTTATELNGKVLYRKTDKREGLIRARMFGAKLAIGDVLVFLDSHVEVNEMWLEPLLARIAEHPNRYVVTPIIDVINPDTLQYTSSPLVRGGFNWGLHFKWENIPLEQLKHDEDFIKPIKSPTMAGGLFAMDRGYFNRLGEYDEQMEIWGGENLELSFRVWMCGGTLEIIPCSRVGHVFKKHRPYTGPNGQDSMMRNSLRVAHVWLDEYKKFYFSEVPEAKYTEYGDVTARQMLRTRLGCESFAWYLRHVYPELVLPDDASDDVRRKWNAVERPVYQKWDQRKRNYVSRFMIRLTNTNLCITSEGDVKTKGSPLILKACLRAKNQIWYETDRKELVLAEMLCLDSGAARMKPKLSKCHELGGTQEWSHADVKNSAIYNVAAGTCLGAESSPSQGSHVIMDLCANSDNTKWNLVS